MASKFTLLSFDLDDTLWPCSPTIKAAENLLYQWLQQNVAEITQQYSASQLHQKRQALLKLQPQLVTNLSQLRIESFKLLAQEFCLEQDWIEKAFNVFYHARQKITLFEEVKPVLTELQKNFTLASLTNGNADANLTGISRWFDYSLNSISVGKLKSQPDIYLQLQKLAKVTRAQHLHVGDDPIQDIVGAQAAGVFAVWLNRKKVLWPLDYCQPDAQIFSLSQLPQLLKQKNGQP